MSNDQFNSENLSNSGITKYKSSDLTDRTTKAHTADSSAVKPVLRQQENVLDDQSTNDYQYESENMPKNSFGKAIKKETDSVWSGDFIDYIASIKFKSFLKKDFERRMAAQAAIPEEDRVYSSFDSIKSRPKKDRNSKKKEKTRVNSDVQAKTVINSHEIPLNNNTKTSSSTTSKYDQSLPENTDKKTNINNIELDMIKEKLNCIDLVAVDKKQIICQSIIKEMFCQEGDRTLQNEESKDTIKEMFCQEGDRTLQNEESKDTIKEMFCQEGDRTLQSEESKDTIKEMFCEEIKDTIKEMFCQEEDITLQNGEGKNTTEEMFCQEEDKTLQDVDSSGTIKEMVGQEEDRTLQNEEGKNTSEEMFCQEEDKTLQDVDSSGTIKETVSQEEDRTLQNEEGKNTTEEMFCQEEDRTLQNEEDKNTTEEMFCQEEDKTLQDVDSSGTIKEMVGQEEDRILQNEEGKNTSEEMIFQEEERTLQNEEGKNTTEEMFCQEEDRILQDVDSSSTIKEMVSQEEDRTLQNEEGKNTSEEMIFQEEDRTLHSEERKGSLIKIENPRSIDNFDLIEESTSMQMKVSFNELSGSQGLLNIPIKDIDEKTEEETNKAKAMVEECKSFIIEIPELVCPSSDNKNIPDEDKSYIIDIIERYSDSESKDVNNDFIIDINITEPYSDSESKDINNDFIIDFGNYCIDINYTYQNAESDDKNINCRGTLYESKNEGIRSFLDKENYLNIPEIEYRDNNPVVNYQCDFRTYKLSKEYSSSNYIIDYSIIIDIRKLDNDKTAILDVPRLSSSESKELLNSYTISSMCNLDNLNNNEISKEGIEELYSDLLENPGKNCVCKSIVTYGFYQTCHGTKNKTLPIMKNRCKIKKIQRIKQKRQYKKKNSFTSYYIKRNKKDKSNLLKSDQTVQPINVNPNERDIIEMHMEIQRRKELQNNPSLLRKVFNFIKALRRDLEDDPAEKEVRGLVRKFIKVASKLGKVDTLASW